MLTEVQAFFDAVDRHHKDYTEGVEAAQTKPNRRSTRPFQTARDHRINAEWALLELSDDALVRFIVTNYANNGYRSQAETVLRALPLNLDGLRKLGREQQWCGDYTRALNTAIREGIVDDGRTPQRRALDQWARQFTTDEGYLGRLATLVDAVVASETITVQLADAVAAKTDKATPETESDDDED